MTKIYIAAYKEFNDYATLKKICDFFLQNLNKNDILFYVSNGELGDKTCMKYVRNNGYNYIDWLPQKKGKNRAEEKLKYIIDSDHAILITNGNSKGIEIAIRYSCKYINKFVVVRTQCNDLQIYKNMELYRNKNINELH